MTSKKSSALKRAGAFAGVLGLGMIGGAVGMLLAKGSGALAPVKPMLEAMDWRDLFVLPLLWLFAVTVHEAGHLAAGMARGMRFLMIVVGFVGVVRAGSRLQWRTYFNLGALGGFAVALPDPQRPLRGQLSALMLGGPFASLALALLAGALVSLLPGRFAAWAFILSALSTLLFVLTAIPLRAGGFMSDGMQWWQMQRDPGFLQRRALLIALMGLGLAGTRPRDLDPDLLARAQAATGDETLFDIATWLYSFHHACDRDDIDVARQWLARIEPVFAEYPDGFRQALALELGLFAALYGDRAVAAAWFAKAVGGVVEPARRQLGAAALAVADGAAADGVHRQLIAAERCLARSMDPGLAQLTRAQIALVRARLATAA